MKFPWRKKKVECKSTVGICSLCKLKVPLIKYGICSECYFHGGGVKI